MVVLQVVGRTHFGFCQSGYKPVLVGTTKHSVKACIRIENCNVNSSNSSFNTVVNACERCNNGFAYKFHNNMVDTTICVRLGNSNVPENCMASDETDCKVCNKGYTLTLDNECTQVVQP